MLVNNNNGTLKFSYGVNYTADILHVQIIITTIIIIIITAFRPADVPGGCSSAIAFVARTESD